MSELWITNQDELRQRRLAQLEGLVAASDEDAAVHRGVAIGGAYVTGLFATLIGTGEYLTHKWGVRQDIETAVGAFTLGITILETKLMLINRKRSDEAWQNAAQFMMQSESE